MLNNLSNHFLKLSRFKKQLIMLFADVNMLVFSLWLSFSIRLGYLYLPQGTVQWLFIISPFIAIPIFVKFGLYRAIVRYIGFKALWTIIKAVSIYALIWSALVFLSGSDLSAVPRSVTLINWLIAILLIGGSRMFVRWWSVDVKTDNLSYKRAKRNVIIYGAGTAGIQLASILEYSEEYVAVAFLDDKSELHKNTINSLQVYSFLDLEKLIFTLNIDEVFIAIPSASHARRKQVIQNIESYPIKIKTLPSLADVADGKIKLEDIKEIDLEDLLGRDLVSPDKALFDACIKHKSVLVTGAGGSIGSELCRQIITREPKQLILFEQSEFNLYQIDNELKDAIKRNKLDIELIPIIGSITDEKRISKILSSYEVNTIYHAAAYKHVPLVEYNINEGVRTNTIGTHTTALAAINNKVDAFILISTDKAVRPTNVMGASKRFAELVLQGLSTKNSKTHFSIVRFGNVLDSSGSVVPLFREQIKQGGPVTVTHPDIIRYFMTIPEAAQLVIQAGAMSTKGTDSDVFVLDMGEPVKIVDLAEKMIHLMGLTVRNENTPDGDIDIEFSGLRPGEKLYEELLIGNNVTDTSHPRIMRAEEEAYSWTDIQAFLQRLDLAIEKSSCEEVRKLLIEVVNGYKPISSIEDILWCKNN